VKAIVFGNREMGCACLEETLDLGVEVPLVVTYPRDAGEAPGFRCLGEVAASRGLECATPPNARGGRLLDRVRALRPHLILSFYYGHRLPDSLLAVPDLGSFNLHGSLLPRWRGRAPLPFVLLHGDEESGVTLHAMVRDFDAGGIAGQERFPVEMRETATTLYWKSVEAARRLLRRTLPLILARSAPLVAMDERAATVTGPLAPLRDLDRGATVERFDRTVRALSRPYPGARLRFGDGFVVIWEGEPGPGPDGIPILLSDGVYRVLRIGEEGGPESTASAFLAAHPGAGRLLGGTTPA
jgi:UDP-4-amino-4-deoxy-L-arabinose formyltransferase/UDP-glucuronic acid dehydrogenase (UDP-4-keto-hexauronic acid decarboxylating)